MNPSSPEFKRTIHIQASPSQVWQALTDPVLVNQYYLCPLKSIDLRVGGQILYANEEMTFIEGEILRVEEEKIFSHTFVFDPGSHDNVNKDKPTRVTYRINPIEGATELTLVHDGFEEENQTYANVTGGWDIILNQLKALLEKK